MGGSETDQARQVAYEALSNAPRQRPDGKRFGTIEGDKMRRDVVVDALDAAGLLAAPAAQPDAALEALRLLVKAVIPEVNEKGAGGYLLARLADARDVLAAQPEAADRDDAKVLLAMARAVARRSLESAVQDLVSDEEAAAGWDRMPENARLEFIETARAALAALREGQRTDRGMTPHPQELEAGR